MSKFAGEMFVMNAIEQQAIKGVVLRISNVVGAPVTPFANCWDLLVNDICMQVIKSGCIELKSKGLQSRDFISISELTRIINFFVDYEGNGCLFNLGSSKSISVIKMAELVRDRSKMVLGINPPIRTLVSHENEMPNILDFKINKLENEGLSISSDLNSEVDNLLMFCRKAFSH
jgi:UDP-glucose 4-epimerase